jgi:hypothetical protein
LITTGCVSDSNSFSGELLDRCQALCREYEAVVRETLAARGWPEHYAPVLRPCDVLGFLDQQTIYVLYRHDTGTMPRQRWRDIRAQGAFTPQDVSDSARSQFAFDADGAFFLSAGALSVPSEQQKQLLRPIAEQYMTMIGRALLRVPAISGYEGLQQLLDRFFDDHPDFTKNVLIAMRFGNSPQSEQIHRAIRTALGRFGLNALRADDKTYPDDDDLWANVCAYMMGCKYAVCVFEDFEQRSFNPNVPLEYGFMRAINRRVLLLKEAHMPTMPSDITGKLYRPFDVFDIDTSIDAAISGWVTRDLGLPPFRQ